MHKILLEDNSKNIIEGQKRLNPIMKEVLKKEIIKWLDAGIFYPISDSVWVSLVQCVPKKGGITVVTNDKNELIQLGLFRVGGCAWIIGDWTKQQENIISPYPTLIKC